VRRALLQMGQAQGAEHSERDEGNSILEERVGPSEPLKIAADGASIAGTCISAQASTSTTEDSTHKAQSDANATSPTFCNKVRITFSMKILFNCHYCPTPIVSHV